MPGSDLHKHSIGWIGAGRMGMAMAGRLLDNGCDVGVWNRTRDKAGPLVERGAVIVDHPAALGSRDIVFTMVAGPEALQAVTLGESGLLAGKNVPRLLIDCSTVSAESSDIVRAAAARRGMAMLAAPVSGNARVVEASKLSIVVSGPREAYDLAEPYLSLLGRGVSYAGEGEVARMVKICHNLLLAAVTQSLAEITVLAEKGGVPRHALLDFINKSVMGSLFTRYKTPAFVNLDFTPTFTPPLLRKDLDLGLAAGRELGVPLPLTTRTRELVQALIDAGHVDDDFATLLLQQAEAAGLALQPENIKVDDGL